MRSDPEPVEPKTYILNSQNPSQAPNRDLNPSHSLITQNLRYNDSRSRERENDKNRRILAGSRVLNSYGYVNHIKHHPKIQNLEVLTTKYIEHLTRQTSET